SDTAAISSSPIAGGWKPRNVLRRVVDESFGIRRDEAYSLRGAASPLERLLPALPDRKHGPGTVAAAPERPELVAWRPVDAHPDDTLALLGLVHALDRLEQARLRDEKADARPAN